MKLVLSLFLLTLAVGASPGATQPGAQPTRATVAKSANAKPSTRVPTAAVIGKQPTTPLPGGTSTAATQPPAQPAPTSSVTLDAYIAALASDVPLTKDEQTDVKTYYLDDGAKLQAILNDPSLSPFDQTQQVDALRDSLDARVEALLGDPSRQSQFVRVERNYRVALVELAAKGGLVPGAKHPIVPEPTATTPAQADKPAPGIPRVDAVPGT